MSTINDRAGEEVLPTAVPPLVLDTTENKKVYNRYLHLYFSHKYRKFNQI